MKEILAAFALPALVTAVVGYLLGSISISIIFTRMFDNHADIRALGSGNAGLTNVLRSVGVKAAVFTFIFDFAKGAASVCIGRAIFRYACAAYGVPFYFTQYGAYLAGLACVLGHIFPLYFGFRGGKGILSAAAMLSFVDWRLFAVSVAVFAVVLLITKIVSVASICGALAFPVSNFLFSYYGDYRGADLPEGPVPLSYVFFTTAMSILIAAILIMKHRSNIIRLKNGSERKLTIRKRNS